MSWIPFTAEHIQQGFSVRELAMHEDAASIGFNGISEQSPGVRIAAVASAIAEQFRGIIRANPQVTTLGPAGTIPAFCLPWAIAIARVSMLGLNPADQDTPDPRRDEYQDAIKSRSTLATMHPAAFALTEPEAVATPAAAASYSGSPLLDF